MKKYEYKLTSSEVMLLMQFMLYSEERIKELIKQEKNKDTKNYYEDMLILNKRISRIIMVSNRYNGYEDRNK